MFNEDVLNSDRHLGFNELPKVAEMGESTSLQQVVRLFTRYHNALSIACWTPMREELKEIRAEANRNSLTGATSFKALAELAAYLDIDALPKKDFSYFYRFSFFLSRQYEHKSIPTSIGIRVWDMFCKKRFQFFLPLCRFVENHTMKFMTEDTWVQVLEFNQVIKSDFSNFDPQGAWPTLIDEFVEHLDRAQQQQTDMNMEEGGGGAAVTRMTSSHLKGEEQRAKRSLAEIDSVVNSLISVKPFDAEHAAEAADVGTPEKKKLKTLH